MRSKQKTTFKVENIKSVEKDKTLTTLDIVGVTERYMVN